MTEYALSVAEADDPQLSYEYEKDSLTIYI